MLNLFHRGFLLEVNSFVWDLYPLKLVLRRCKKVKKQEQAGSSRHLKEIAIDASSTTVNGYQYVEKNDKSSGVYKAEETTGGQKFERPAASSSSWKENVVYSPDDLYLPAIHGCRDIGIFKILNKIKEGSFGVVYKAIEKSTGDVVALKRFKLEKEKEFPIAPFREINLLRKLQHPNIVSMMEVVGTTTMESIYIVMEFVEWDLSSLLKSAKEPLLIGEVKTLMIQLLDAVQYFHDQWIIHRDLKPSNLLINQNGVLKVADFGISREYGDPLKPYTPHVVTQWYRSPELLLGSGRKLYSTPVDMWSVGCIFAELITLKPFFEGHSEIEQVQKIVKKLGPLDGEDYENKYQNIKEGRPGSVQSSDLRHFFDRNFTSLGLDLLHKFLMYDPSKRIAANMALKHGYFDEAPSPVSVGELAKELKNYMDPSNGKRSRKEEFTSKGFFFRF